MHVLIVFGNGRGLLFMSFYMNISVCNLHNPYHASHIENHKQHTADLQLLVALFPSRLVLVHVFASQTQAGLWCVLLGSDP